MQYSEIRCRRISINESAGAEKDIVISKRSLSDNFPLHWHECFEIELVVEGRMRQTLNGKSYELSKGGIYLLNPTDFHEIEILEPTTVYNLMFNENMLRDELLQKILGAGENIIFTLPDEEFHAVLFMLSRMLFESEQKLKYSDELIRNLVDCIFIIIRRMCEGKTDILKTRPDTAISKALIYIHSRFRENPRMRDAADAASLNPSYFSNLFHKTTGKTYKQYLTELKLTYSKKLLFSTNLSVTEICFACGFNSLSNFLREFRKFYGTAPAEFRKNNSPANFQ